MMEPLPTTEARKCSSHRASASARQRLSCRNQPCCAMSTAPNRSRFNAPAGSHLDVEAATAALQTLPVEQREIIVAHLWGGLTFEQIAELTATSSSTAHRWYLAGLSSLRERLGVACPKQPTSLK